MKIERKSISQFKKGPGTEIFIGLSRIATVFLLVVLLLLIGKIVVEGISVINLDFLISEPRNNMSEGGIGPAIFGTLAVTILVVIMAVPLGVCSAIYLSEYSSRKWFYRIIRSSINNLAGVPSIVMGLFGIGFFVHFIGSNLDTVLDTGKLFGQPVMLWAAATLAVLVLPVIIVSALEALNAVPDEYKNSAYAMGATKWQVIRHVILPQASPGILTGTILAVSRSMGETAPILFLGAAFFLPDLPVIDITIAGLSIPMINPAEQFMYLSYHIFILSTQSFDLSQTRPMLYGSALVLVLLTVALNITAIIFRYKFRKSLGRI